MTKSGQKNLPGSIRQRLLNLAKEQNVDFTHVLIRYAIERTLFRLSISQHADRFFLKGAMLLSLWSKQPYRPTLDVDFLASGDSSMEAIRAVFQDVLLIDCPEDALRFMGTTLRIEPIKEGQQYEGHRVTFTCELAQAVVPVQIDIAFGDAVIPGPLKLAYPTLLELPAPVILTYPRETVIAEKFEAMVKLGMANTRMKDLSDLHFLANNFEFDGELLAEAMTATFNRRRTPIPKAVPTAMTEQFFDNDDKRKQWNGFLKKSNLSANTPELDLVCQRLRDFLMPPCQAASSDSKLVESWSPQCGWQQKGSQI